MRNWQLYAIDFDGTLVTNKWPEVGEPIEDIVNLVHNIQINGDQWILYTMREGKALEEALEVINNLGLFPDAINDNHPDLIAEFGNNPRKIYADHYVDDHNLIRISIN